LQFSQPLKFMHILVVEDHSDSREIFKFVLDHAGARVDVAESVEAAVNVFSQDTPDLVVTDIGMRGRDGYALFARIQEFDRDNGLHTPVIAITGLASPNDRKRALNSGFDAYLVKPVGPVELIRAVASAATSKAA
jgi:CheY-like chemotaxis protein